MSARQDEETQRAGGRKPGLLRGRVLLRAVTAVVLGATLTLGPPRTAPARDLADVIVDLAKGEDFRLRVSAALALGKTGNPIVREPLERALADDAHPAVRAAAAAGLGALGDPASEPALARAAKNDASESVRAAAKASAAKLKEGGAQRAAQAKAKVLVKLGTMTNRSDVRTGDLATMLSGATRDHASKLPGIEILPDGADAKAAATARKLPVVTLDGSIRKLSQSATATSIVLSAQVEYVIKREASLKGSVTGAAQAQGDATTDAQRLEALQRAALAGAVESALRNAPEALALAVK